MCTPLRTGWPQFKDTHTDGQSVCLELVQCPGQHECVLPDGSVKPPHQTGKGQHGQFTESVHSIGPVTTRPPSVAPDIEVCCVGNLSSSRKKAVNKSQCS